ncbi:MAG: hypothetical protein ACLPUO_11170 [Streptosporangiaceae bacterium]
MTAVYYSLTCDANGPHELQWTRSVDSLRRHNRDIDVTLCLYGPARANTLQAAERAGVRILAMGNYAEAFGDIPEHWRRALSRYPTMHKLLSLRRFAAEPALDELIYLDCDTYLFGDVAELAARYSRCHWYAREEPGSTRSHYGYNPSYLNENALAGLARSEGLVHVPPYNTGVFVLKASLVRMLVTLLDDFSWYAWRLLLGACLWQPHLVDDRGLLDFVHATAGAGERRLALPYPSSNFWIIEQIATWLTLGRVPDLTHDVLERPDVVQADEYLTQAPGYLVAHYFSVGEERFVARLGATS